MASAFDNPSALTIASSREVDFLAGLVFGFSLFFSVSCPAAGAVDFLADSTFGFPLFSWATRPQEALPNSQLGMNYSFLGQDDLGLKYLIIAREIDPNHFSHPQITLARIYTRRGENESAARELRDFLSRHPDSDDARSVRKWLSLVQKEEPPESP